MIRSLGCLCIALIQCIFIFAISGSQAQQQTPPSTPPTIEKSDLSALRAKAEAGDPEAQLQIAKAYETGSGVSQNYETALAWYKKAATQGNASAANQVGVMYQLGRGVNKDQTEAIVWYHRGAKAGNADSMFNLGACYYNGDGVPGDGVAADVWFLAAQAAGSSPAKDAVHRSEGELGPWLLLSAFVQLGRMYEKGDELPQNYGEAARCYKKALPGSAEAAVRLAALLVAGNGVQQDYAYATQLCRDASKKGYGLAYSCLGYIYQHGFGVRADTREAIKWYREGSSRGSFSAIRALAHMYEKGDGVAADRAEAFCLLFLAYQQGFLDSKSEAQSLRQNLNIDETRRLEKKLKERHLDSKMVYEIIDDPGPPDASKARSLQK